MALIMVWEESVKGRDEGRGDWGREAPPFLFMQDRFRGQSVLSPASFPPPSLPSFLPQSVLALDLCILFSPLGKGRHGPLSFLGSIYFLGGEGKWVWLIKSRYRSCRFFTDPQKNRLNRFRLMIFRTWEGERGDSDVRGHSISAR